MKYKDTRMMCRDNMGTGQKDSNLSKSNKDKYTLRVGIQVRHLVLILCFFLILIKLVMLKFRRFGVFFLILLVHLSLIISFFINLRFVIVSLRLLSFLHFIVFQCFEIFVFIQALSFFFLSVLKLLSISFPSNQPLFFYFHEQNQKSRLYVDNLDR